MDIKKDTNNGQKDTMGVQKREVLSITWNSPLCAFAYKKTEKLASALHMVTGSVPDGEPVKNKLRDKSLCLLSEIISYRTMSKDSGPDIFIGHRVTENAVSIVSEVVALLEVARASRFISEMNATLLRREYLALCTLLNERYEEILGDTKHISSDFFDAEAFYREHEMKQSDERKSLSEQSNAIFSGGANKERDFMSDRNKIEFNHYGTQRRSNNKRHIFSHINKSVGNKSSNHRLGLGKTHIRHNERRNIILKLFESKNKINVKDVSEVIGGCSEKTLQRELLTLVKQSVLKKEGERRWSVYSLA